MDKKEQEMRTLGVLVETLRGLGLECTNVEFTFQLCDVRYTYKVAVTSGPKPSGG